MGAPKRVIVTLAAALVIGFWSVCTAMTPRTGPIEPPRDAMARVGVRQPFVIIQQGDTAWVTPYPDTSYCPGDPLGGHGGEATGGPDGSETWCFENAPYIDLPGENGENVLASDSCGTNSPWTYLCFDHVDVRTLPSQTGINFWHIDTYRTDEAGWPYSGGYCLWCGSDSVWEGQVVECGTWATPPGYGNQWSCIVELDLADTFSTAGGCTLYFDLRYDTECGYDYFYLDFHDGTLWQRLATFNSSSDCPDPMCAWTDWGTIRTPDYFSNSNYWQPDSTRWQSRRSGHEDEPTFYRVLTPDTLTVTEGPKFRWWFTSDGAGSDADGWTDTDGGAFVDNVWVVGDPGSRYVEDFEDGSWAVLASRGWSRPDPDPFAQGWHLIHDPDPPYEGQDGGERSGCLNDSSLVWRARPDGGFPGGAPWRNMWYYRLVSPKVAIINTGCVVQYDQYICALDYTCDYMDTKVRFYDNIYGRWCPWIDIDGQLQHTCSGSWDVDKTDDVSFLYGAGADSVQFAWDAMDLSFPPDFCYGKHKSTDYQIDNVSIGFFDDGATLFRVRLIDLLHDGFHDSICGYNSFFDAHNADTILAYSGPPYTPEIPRYKQFVLDVIDRDGLEEVNLYGSIDRGATWVYHNMATGVPYDIGNPELGGEHYGTFCPDDFGLDRWDRGTEVWYYVRAEDENTNIEYFPATADPSSPGHTGTSDDYLSFSILPLFPDEYPGVKILLIDGYQQTVRDWQPCLEQLETKMPLADIYGRTLADAGYCYDRFDINGVGANPHIHPIQYDSYDAIVWFTGPNIDDELIDIEAMEAIEAYMAQGGKVILCGDRLADYMDWGVGDPPLIWLEFQQGIMGCYYIEEMESAFGKPYVYAQAVDTIDVLGIPTAIELDSLLLYRGCPGDPRDMSYVTLDPYPLHEYTIQRFLKVLNRPGYIPEADAGIYTEHGDSGQCVFLNFGLSSMPNHDTGYCDGVTPYPAPDFQPGTYEGRVELMRVVLEDIFGLPSNGPGGGGAARVEPRRIYRWALEQNTPNPFTSSTVIRFEVARMSDVSIKIYNALGQLVDIMVDERKEPGRYSVRWDGKNAVGETVSSGVYFYKMTAGDFASTRKMLVVN